MLRVLFLFLSFSIALDARAELESVPDFTDGMQRQSGYFDFYYDDQNDKVYLAVDKLDTEFLFQSSLPQGVGSNDIGLDRGQLGEARIVRFERYGNKILLKQLNTNYRASSSNTAEKASIDEAFADSVIAGFTAEAESNGTYVIDYTDFLLTDVHGLAGQLKDRKQGSFKVDRSRSGVYLPRTKSFPENTEFEALITFGGSGAGDYLRSVTPDASSVSVHLHHSLIKLPDDNYETRAFHPYSGFWKVEYQDYSAPIEDSMAQRFIPRHRLSKKDPGAQYSDPVEPIIYYLDPGIPEPVMGALRDGALWWNRAFELAGYKNAFQVKVLPQDADPMDVRYNVIQWVHRSTRGWSYGGSVIDPRTGEIIKGHVTLGSLRVRQDYLIALGLTSPFDSANANTDEQLQLALARIRQLSAHEVGHTLGIAHNFAASEDGRESVMDYPHPYVTLNNGNIELEDAYDVGMGVWDNYVIAYGYQDFSDSADEAAELKKLIQNARNRGLGYISDPDARAANSASSKGHLWDSGSDPVDELKRVIQVREVALSNFGLNSIPEGTALSALEESLVPIYLFHRYQVDAVAKLIGGVTYEYESKGDYASPKGVVAVDSTRQINALEVLISTMTPEFLTLPENILQVITPKAYGNNRNRESFKGRTGVTFDAISAAESAAGYTLSLMMMPERLNRLAQQHALDNSKPSVSDIVARLMSKSIRSNASANSAIQTRVNYVVLDKLVSAMDNRQLAPEVKAELQFQLMRLHDWLKSQSGSMHAAVMSQWLELLWNTGEWKGDMNVKPLPPGSPI
jgi:hypothetical protein